MSATISPKKILVIKLRALGDTVILSSSLEVLRKAYPRAEISVLVPARWMAVLSGNPAVNRVIEFDRFPWRPIAALQLFWLAWRLRRERFDCVINFHASSSSALLARATKAPVRSIHFHGHRDENKGSTVAIPGKGQVKPAIERDLDALRALGIQIAEAPAPRIFLNDSELENGRRYLSDRGLRAPVLALGIGASRPSKSWAMDRYAEVARGWLERTQGSVLALCGPGEEGAAIEFLSLIPPELQRVKAESGLSIRQLAYVLAACSVSLGNDSGPKHVAAAVGVRTCTIFGPEDPYEWHPYSRDLHPRFFVEGLSCRRDAQAGMPAWCGLRSCDQPEQSCMTRIPAEDVLRECERISKR